MGQFMEDTILTKRTLILPMGKLRTFLRRGQADSFAWKRYDSSPEARVPDSDDRYKTRREKQLASLHDDPVTAIWIDFIVELFLAILGAIGFDIDGAGEGIRAVCYAIWDEIDSIRSSVISFSQVPESTLVQIIAPGAVHSFTPLTQYEWSTRPALSPRDIQNAGGVVEMTVNLVWRLFTSGQLRALIKALPRVSWWSLLRFEAKLIPYVGQAYLAVCIAIALTEIGLAIDKLIRRLKENEKKKYKARITRPVGW